VLRSLFPHFDKIVVLDVETTGLDCRKDEIIELAAIRVALGVAAHRIEYEISTLIQLSCAKKLPNHITSLTGITEQMLLNDGQPKYKVCDAIVEILSCPKTLIAAYNAQLDLCFLYFFLMRFERETILKKVKMLDVMSIYKDRRDYPHKLRDAVNAYGIEHENSHRAIADAKATLAVLSAMDSEKDDLHKYINLFGYNPKYGISGPKISSITYLPQGYNRSRRLYEQAD
jgi:DNA polymerase-3 subunit epsilon